MNATVSAQFGMKRGSHYVYLANQGRQAIATGQNIDSRSHLKNPRGSDENHLQRAARQRGFATEDARVDLAPEGIALDNRIEYAEASLGRIADLARKQDGSRAGAKDRALPAEPLQVVKEATPFEKLEHGCGLAAGEDQSVETLKLVRLAHLDRRSA